MSGTLDKVIKKVLFEAMVRYGTNNQTNIEYNPMLRDYASLLNKDYHVGISLNDYTIQKNSKPYSIFSGEGYIFVPPGVIVKRMNQNELGYGTLGIAIKSLGLIGVLETLYGNDFNEVLMHESIHLENWDATESWVRQETKQRCDFETRFH